MSADPKKKFRVTDRMRIDALAAAISTTRVRGKSGRRTFRALTIRVLVWKEGFTVHFYNGGREVESSVEPKGDIEEALRDALAGLFGGPRD